MTFSNEGGLRCWSRPVVERSLKFVRELLVEAQKSKMCKNLLIIHH